VSLEHSLSGPPSAERCPARNSEIMHVVLSNLRVQSLSLQIANTLLMLNQVVIVVIVV
jgi:hypothetical protein